LCFIGGLAAERWGEPRSLDICDAEGIAVRQQDQLRPLADVKAEPDVS